MRNFIRFITVCSFVWLFFFPIAKTYANDHSLESIHIHTFIHEDGSATITETRKAYLTEGTENYIVIGNLGKSEITNFIVEENGITYEFIENWNIHASQSEKSFKNGIIKTDDGYELCWGIGEYGAHEYILQYTVTNFIKQLDDAQILFWRYINDETNIPPERVRIEIETSRPLTSETESIWGFGFEGEIHFLDERIVAYNSVPFDSSNYATILVQFPLDSFQTGDVLDQSFDEIYERAVEGSDYEDDASWIIGIIIIIFIFIVIGPSTIIFLISKMMKAMKQAKERRKIMEEIKGMYNRDLPFHHEFLDLYYLLKKIGLTKERYIYTALFLKWIYQGDITIQTDEKEGVFRTKKQISLKFNNKVGSEENKQARRLYNIFASMTNSANLLSSNQIRLANDTNKRKILRWEQNLEKNSQKHLLKHGYLTKIKQRSLLFFKVDRYVLTEKGKQLQKDILMFEQYLEDFSLVHEREAIEVKIWDQILIWAAAIGMTDVVLDQFKQLYPEYVEESVYPLESIASLHYFSTTIHNNTVSSSSGGGGFTSSGGGGGSFGGGSGGGTR